MKYGYIERERRFLIKNLPLELRLDGEYRCISDRYFPKTHLRLRRITTPEGQLIQQKFARKQLMSDSSHASITNLYLDPNEYQLLSSLGGLEIHKRRYRYAYGEYMFGIDVFEGQLSGLVLGEVEFPTDEAMELFRSPDFCTVEVTDEPFFRGGHLATVQADVLHRELRAIFE
ncbi:MAG: hypothetical protein HY785_08220 [Oscillatoriophycideae cyanobacterium NC_groundwater_1537_Pr4_S-0.65um_50_18]|nr:hypothetical protein [Oscillatoriophycideae cyanobacterium NC_groundwater_1537_Pr4_S-0.65um_50_18]